MSESLKYFRQKKGTWIWVYDMETNRRKKLELLDVMGMVMETFALLTVRTIGGKNMEQEQLNTLVY